MFKKILLTSLLLAGIILVGLRFSSNFGKENPLIQEAPTANRHISYSLAIKNVGSSLLSKTSVWIRVPNKRIANQVCLDLKANLPFNLETDDANNQVLRFPFKSIPPYATIIINIDAQLAMNTTVTQEKPRDEDDFLDEEKYIELANKDLRALAKQLAANTPKETAKNIFTWVSQNLVKTEYSKQPKGAAYAFRKRSGDCTEFMHLLVALCRLNNIPARCVNGYFITKDSHISANDLHDWAQIYFDGSWHLADAFYNSFLKDEEKYIAVQVQTNNPQQNSFYRWQTDSPDLQIELIN
jgi:transglutaminase-like putative cysteine protease